MAQVTQEMCGHIINEALEGRRFNLTLDELSQLASLALTALSINTTTSGIPQVISNSETKRNKELKEKINSAIEDYAAFQAWFKTGSNANLDSQLEENYLTGWQGCSEYYRLKLSGEKGQTEIWKQRAQEWCDEYHKLCKDEEKVREDFLEWWCENVPENYREEVKRQVDEDLKSGCANEQTRHTWEGVQFGLKYGSKGAAKPRLTREQATELVNEYGRAVLKRNGPLVSLTMENLLEHLMGPVDEDAQECLLDVITHHNDFKDACVRMRNSESGDDGRSYWDHQINVLKRMRDQAQSALVKLGVEIPQVYDANMCYGVIPNNAPTYVYTLTKGEEK